MERLLINHFLLMLNKYFLNKYIEIRGQSKYKHLLRLPYLPQPKSSLLQEIGPSPTLTFSFFSLSKATSFCLIIPSFI